MDKILFYIFSVVLVTVGLVLLARPKLVSDAKFSDSIVIPTSVLLIALGLAAAAYPSSQYFKSAPESTPTVSPAPESAPTATSVPIAITSPTGGAGVRENFTVSGTAPNLGNDKLWLFVWANNATVQGKVYYRTSPVPIDIVGDIWSIQLGELGRPGKDIGNSFFLVLVRANPSCSSVIEHIAPNPAKDVFIRELPNGCSVVRPPLVVKKES